MVRAAIDVGSNSVLLLVAERREGAWRPIRERSRVTGLGTGVKKTGRIAEAPMAATLAAIADFSREARELGAEEVRAAATMAARIAENASDFLERARAQGTPVFVLPGDEEAELGFRAVADDPTFADAQRLSIIDPGGNSTELVTADRSPDRWTVAYRKSHQIGTLGLRDGLLHDEAPDAAARLAAVGEIDGLIGLEYRPGEAGQPVVLGATGTNLVTIRERMTDWDPGRVHGQTLDYEEVSRAVGWLSGMGDAERAQIVGLEPGREKTIHIGALILERFLFALRAPACRVSVRGWRHALLERASGSNSSF